MHGELPILLGLQKLEREIFQLGLDPGHTEAVGQRGVDLSRFQCDAGAPLGREMLQRPHVVQPIAQLDDDDPGVFGDRQQELAVILDLLLGRRMKGEAGDFGEAVYDAGDFGSELPGNVLGPNVRVLHHIVQQRGSDGCAVEQLLGQDQGDGDSVGDEILPRHPLLAPMRGGAEAQRPLDQLEIQTVGVLLQDGPKIRSQGRECSSHNSPAVAKLTYRSPAMMT